MKTDKQIRQILVDNLCPSPIGWVSVPDNTDIHNLTIDELERLVAIATSQQYWMFNNPCVDFVEWCLKTIQSKQFEKSEHCLTIDQLDIVGIPTGISNLWGNDSINGDDVY